jgi:hypothetical protein
MTSHTKHPARGLRPRGDLDEPGVGGRARGEGLATALSAEADERLRRIREEAYYRAERRNFVPGQEMDDWLAAERALGEPTRGSGRDG